MATGSPQRSPFFIPVLVLFIVGLLLFIGTLLNYVIGQAPSRTDTPTSPVFTYTLVASPSPSVTSTTTLTPRPTWTLRPSATASQTPTPTSTNTPTLVPTLTPATPARINMWYKLKPWDFSEQERALELLRANTVLTSSDSSFAGLAYGEGEAILRFPDTLDATHWRWDRAYNLVRVQDPLGITLYSDLIRSAIASGQVRAADLPTWFSLYETRLTLNISSLTPQPGELGRSLIELVGEGSAFLWLVEIPGATNIYPLMNDIDYHQPHQNAFLYEDLTGDTTPELVIYRQNTPGITLLTPPHIFDLTVSPPLELPIQEQAPFDFGLEPRTQADMITDIASGNDLRFIVVLLPACPVYVQQDYHWDGESFTVTPMQFSLEPITGQTAFCQIALDEASARWGPEAAINIANAMLGVWPPATDIEGHPYAPDAFDQLRYRLAIEYALAGQSPQANQMMSDIVDTPVTPDSAWVIPAQEFLHFYQTPHDLYQACQSAQFCNLRDAFKTMVEMSATSDFSQALLYLQSHGITIRSSGIMDFNQDGHPERWVIILPKPGDKLEFWILYDTFSAAQAQVRAVFVQILEAGETLPWFHEPVGTIPIFQFELQRGYVFRYLDALKFAYVKPVDVEYARPTTILDGYHRALNDLMAGSDPGQVKNALLALFTSPRFAGDCIAFNICDQFHYTLALVYDLLGDSDNAIDQYLWAWRNYGQSPYATMARLKMNFFPLPTYTRTPIPSRTPIPTRTITPTRSITPTRTSTRTPTQTATVTPTPTPTDTGTPTFTPTPTSTDTPTLTATSTATNTATPTTSSP